MVNPLSPDAQRPPSPRRRHLKLQEAEAVPAIYRKDRDDSVISTLNPNQGEGYLNPFSFRVSRHYKLLKIYQRLDTKRKGVLTTSSFVQAFAQGDRDLVDLLDLGPGMGAEHTLELLKKLINNTAAKTLEWGQLVSFFSEQWSLAEQRDGATKIQGVLRHRFALRLVRELRERQRRDAAVTIIQCGCRQSLARSSLRKLRYDRTRCVAASRIQQFCRSTQLRYRVREAAMLIQCAFRQMYARVEIQKKKDAIQRRRESMIIHEKLLKFFEGQDTGVEDVDGGVAEALLHGSRRRVSMQVEAIDIAMLNSDNLDKEVNEINRGKRRKKSKNKQSRYNITTARAEELHAIRARRDIKTLKTLAGLKTHDVGQTQFCYHNNKSIRHDLDAGASWVHRSRKLKPRQRGLAIGGTVTALGDQIQITSQPAENEVSKEANGRRPATSHQIERNVEGTPDRQVRSEPASRQSNWLTGPNVQSRPQSPYVNVGVFTPTAPMNCPSSKVSALSNMEKQPWKELTARGTWFTKPTLGAFDADSSIHSQGSYVRPGRTHSTANSIGTAPKILESPIGQRRSPSPFVRSQQATPDVLNWFSKATDPVKAARASSRTNTLPSPAPTPARVLPQKPLLDIDVNYDHHIAELVYGTRPSSPCVTPKTRPATAQTTDMQPELVALLTSLGLAQYLPELFKYGYDRLEDVQGMSQVELIEDINMKKGHARRLRKHFSSALRMQM